MKSRIFLMVIAGLLGGCVSLGGLNKAPDLAQGSVTTGISENAAVKVAMQGTVKVPSSLVANNVNGLVGNNANALVANNASALVANNANALSGGLPGGFRAVMTIQDEGVAGMPVAAYSAAGDRVSEVATTDKDGKFTLSVPTGAPVLIGAIAPAAKIRQLAVGYPGSSVTVNAASTFAAYKVWESGQLTKAGKIEFAELVNAVAAALKESDLAALGADDNDLKAKVAAIVARSPAIKAAAENLASAASSSGSSSSGDSSSGSSGSSGTSGKTRSAITVGSWPIAADLIVSPGDPFDYVKSKPGAVPLTHNAPSIKAGDVVRFTIIIEGAGSGTDGNAYVRLVGSSGSEVARLAVSTKSGSEFPACGSGYNAASCKADGNDAWVTFKITAGADVSSLEFGADGAAQLTQIDVNPDAD